MSSSEDPKPIDMVLHCPYCGMQHIDKPDPTTGWENPPHKSHLCADCGRIWRPADVPTNGVYNTQTHGANDSVVFGETMGWRVKMLEAKISGYDVMEQVLREQIEYWRGEHRKAEERQLRMWQDLRGIKERWEGDNAG